MNHAGLREEVTRISRRMSEAGLVSGTSGNVSARAEDGNVLITPGGLDYGVLEPADIVLVSLEGDVLEGSLAPSSETPMHTGLYREKPEVGGIVHTHATHATTLACAGMEIPPVHYLLAALSEEGRVPVVPYATYGSDRLARYAAETLSGGHSVCLLQNHGTLAVGGSVAEAYSRTEVLEEMAELYCGIRAIGRPLLLTRQEITEARRKLLAYGQHKSDASKS